MWRLETAAAAGPSKPGRFPPGEAMPRTHVPDSLWKETVDSGGAMGCDVPSIETVAKGWSTDTVNPPRLAVVTIASILPDWRASIDDVVPGVNSSIRTQYADAYRYDELTNCTRSGNRLRRNCVNQSKTAPSR